MITSLHCHCVVSSSPLDVNILRPFVTSLPLQLETHSQLIRNSFKILATTATLGNFFKQFEKIAKCWQPLTMMVTYWHHTVDHLRPRAMCWQSPVTSGCHHVASIISVSVNVALCCCLLILVIYNDAK